MLCHPSRDSTAPPCLVSLAHFLMVYSMPASRNSGSTEETTCTPDNATTQITRKIKYSYQKTVMPLLLQDMIHFAYTTLSLMSVLKNL